MWKNPKKDNIKETEKLIKDKARFEKEKAEMISRTFRHIVGSFNHMIKDEEEAIKIYEAMIWLYGDFGWRKVFDEILTDEKEHLTKLKIARDAVIETFKKTGEIRSL